MPPRHYLSGAVAAARWMKAAAEITRLHKALRDRLCAKATVPSSGAKWTVAILSY